MFHSKILHSVFLNILPRSTITWTTEVSAILNSKQRLPKQVLNSRNIHNYKKSWDNENSSKIYRTLIFHKYIRLIKQAVRDSGPILGMNPKLAQVIESAKEKNLPPEFINFAIKITGEIRGNFGLYDLLLSNGCHFLIQYEDIDSTTTKHHLLGLCEKYDGTLLQGETVWPRSFHQKGIISVPCQDSDPLSNLSDESISELGVQSFQVESDVEGVKYWKFYCDPWKLPEVKKQICEITNNIEEAFIGYIPKKKNIPSQYLKNNIFIIFSKLSEVPTIDNVYTNANII